MIISPVTPPHRQYHRYVPYCILAVVLSLLFVALASLHPTRVGDGAEYYAMFCAWLSTHRPWMTPESWQAYDALVNAHGIANMVPTDALTNAFPVLRVGDTADLNHFWFYSMLAWGCHQAAAVFGVEMGAHASFLAVHSILLTITVSLAWRHYRWQGVTAVALMIFGSPVFWFVDKVHTELMTVCLVLSAVIVFTARRYLAAFAFLAVAATQNPSFAMVACIPLFCRVVYQRGQRYTVAEGAVFVAFSALILAHPLYYHDRYGVMTPTLLAGGAVFGAHLREFYVWILDPDIGLLPNWPLGLLAVIVAGVAWLRQRKARTASPDVPWLLFLAGTLAIDVYAQSSTTNLNSAATPGLARYALWYLPLLFPLFLRLIRTCRVRSRTFHAAVPLLALLMAVSLGVNDPRRVERNGDPSLSSRLVQNYLPGLYDPPVEIYLERYSGLAEDVHARPLRLLVGPDCRKMLVLPGPGRRLALASPKCLYDPVALEAWANSAGFGQTSGKLSQAPYYASIGAERADTLRMALASGTYGLQAGGSGRKYLESGWGASEVWGAPAIRPRANLMFPCHVAGGKDAAHPVAVGMTLRPFGRQPVTVSAQGARLWQGVLAGADQDVRVVLPLPSCKDGYYKLELDIPGAVAPDVANPANPRRAATPAVGLVTITVDMG